MYDLNNANDVIEGMREGEMSDEDIIRVCQQVITNLTVNSFRDHLIELYPTAELHHRMVRPNDIMSQIIEFKGKEYRIRKFDVDVVYWCEV